MGFLRGPCGVFEGFLMGFLEVFVMFLRGFCGVFESF